jgi:fatty-acyl-CoA synthase
MAAHNRPDIGLGRMIAKRAKLTPNNRALTFEGETWTYRELLDRVDRLAASLRDGGVRSGDRVAFIGTNHPSFFVTLFATARLGAVFVPLNFRLTPAELDFIINDSGVHTLVASDDHKATIDTVRESLPCTRYIGADSGSDGWENLADTLTGTAPNLDTTAVDADDVALIMYTSGTTGRPKGAMLTHGNLAWNNVNGLHALVIGNDEVSLVVAPLFHIGALNVTTLVTLQKGGEVVIHQTFDPGAALEAIEEYGVTNMFGVPAIYSFMSQHPKFESTDFSSVRLFVVGGAPVPEQLLKIYNGKGIPFAQGYGLTETAPFSTFLLPEYALEKVGSAGYAPLYTDVCVMDADGLECPPGTRGEICTRGPNVMAGYWNRPDATAEAIDREGWFHSGDLGYLDDEGFLFVVDRVKDMVITGGENVYPAEIESVLYEHPSVVEVAVIGLPDERWGEAVTAVVALKPDESLTLEELRTFGAEKLAKYKLPSRLETVDALPRNPAGKVLKFELRQRFADQDSPIS